MDLAGPSTLRVARRWGPSPVRAGPEAPDRSPLIAPRRHPRSGPPRARRRLVVIEPSTGLPVSSTVVAAPSVVLGGMPEGAGGVERRSRRCLGSLRNLRRPALDPHHHRPLTPSRWRLDLGDGQWTPERESPFAWDGEVGRRPGQPTARRVSSTVAWSWNVGRGGRDWRLTDGCGPTAYRRLPRDHGLASSTRAGWARGVARTDGDGPSRDWPTVDARADPPGHGGLDPGGGDAVRGPGAPRRHPRRSVRRCVGRLWQPVAGRPGSLPAVGHQPPNPAAARYVELPYQ